MAYLSNFIEILFDNIEYYWITEISETPPSPPCPIPIPRRASPPAEVIISAWWIGDIASIQAFNLWWKTKWSAQLFSQSGTLTRGLQAVDWGSNISSILSHCTLTAGPFESVQVQKNSLHTLCWSENETPFLQSKSRLPINDKKIKK